MELVEQLDSGVQRILQFYGKECFKFSENFIRMSFPMVQVTEQVTEQVNLLIHILDGKMDRQEIKCRFADTQINKPACRR